MYHKFSNIYISFQIKIFDCFCLPCPTFVAGTLLSVQIQFFPQANCIDSTAKAEAVFAGEVKKMRAEKMKPLEQVTLEPYERDHAVVVGMYRPPAKDKD